jgi:gliding motility-associated-like protein
MAITKLDNQMNKFICSLVLLLTLFTQSLLAKPSTSENLSFEKGDFTNWTGKTWLHFYSEILNLTTGIEPGRHTIMSDTTAYDKNTGGKLKLIPTGYKYSARLGDSISGCRSQSLSYTLKVDSTNALFIWKFAVVLQDPLHEHLSDEQPRFKITLEDQDGNTISSCSQYDVNAAEGIPGFQNYYPQGFTRDTDSVALVVWRDWTTAGANLMPFYGKKVTITFTTEDCTKQGHFGYAYFVAECRPMQISVNYCKDDTDARLEAPEGFSSYVWTPGNIEGRVLTVNNAMLGNQYTCAFQSVMGCPVELSATIKRTTPDALFQTSLIDANKNLYQFTNASTANSGSSMNFAWNFGDGCSSTAESPTHQFATSGKHTVTLEVTALPSGCKNTRSADIVISKPVPLTITGDSTFCQGNSTTLTASGRVRYSWSTGATTATTTIDKGGRVFVIGWNEHEKCDTAYITIKEKTTPVVTISGAKMICPGETVKLTANGASTYTWSNRETTSSINVSSAGLYSVAGTSSNGCSSKAISVNLTEDTPWQPVITGDTLFCSNSQTTLTANGASTYKWNNGTTSPSITVNQDGTYTVLATNRHGCQAQSSVRVWKIVPPEVNFELSPEKLNVHNPVISVSAVAQTDTQYEWHLGDGTVASCSSFTHRYNVSSPTSDYTITLNAINKHGCVSSFTKSVTFDFKVPNVFTPNNDGYNDTFMPDYDLQIFDRNGIRLYAGNKGWDGTYKGSRMSPDTYFYLLRYTDNNNSQQVKKGSIMLIRQ